MLLSILLSLFFLQAADLTFVKEVTTLASDEVQLMDLAQVSNATSEVEDTVLRMALFPPTNKEETIEISNLEMMKKVKPLVQAKISLPQSNTWVYFLPEKIKIKRTLSQISEQRLQNEIKLELQKKCSNCLIKNIVIKRPDNFARILSWKIDFQNLPLQKSFLLPMKIKTVQAEDTIWLNVTAGLFQEGYKTTALVNREQKLTLPELKKEWIEIGNFKDRLASIEEIQSGLMNKTLSVHQPIQASDLKKELLISRGQIVKIISGSDYFEVTSQAQAEDAGFYGDIVKLKSMDQKKQMSGIVIEKGVVRIQ